MNFKNTTQVPNSLFDTLLPGLSKKELKILLVIIRQTNGWIDTNGKRKKRDWISQKLFIKKTGLAKKSVSDALDLLTKKNLIRSTDIYYRELDSAKERKGKSRIYFELNFGLVQKLNKPCSKNILEPVQKLHYTKLTLTKRERKHQPKQKLSDYERYCEILEGQARQNIENN